MKILLTDWYTQWHGSTPQVLKPVELPLDDQKVLFGLVVFLGNGEYDEACIESDSRESRECITGLLCGSGGAKACGTLSGFGTVQAASRRL